MFTREELESLSVAKIKKIIDYMKLDIDFSVYRTKYDLIDAVLDLTDLPMAEQLYEEPRVSVRVQRIKDLKKRGLL